MTDGYRLRGGHTTETGIVKADENRKTVPRVLSVSRRLSVSASRLDSHTAR